MIVLEHVDPDSNGPDNMARISRNFRLLAGLFNGVQVFVGNGPATPGQFPAGNIYFDYSTVPPTPEVTT